MSRCIVPPLTISLKLGVSHDEGEIDIRMSGEEQALPI